MPARLDRGVARLRLGDPGLRRRARRRRQLRKLGERAGEIGLRGAHLDARHDRRGIVARRHRAAGRARAFPRSPAAGRRKRLSRGVAPAACRSAGSERRQLARRARPPTARRSPRTAPSGASASASPASALAAASSAANGSPRSTVACRSAAATASRTERSPRVRRGALGKLGLERLRGLLERSDAIGQRLDLAARDRRRTGRRRGRRRGLRQRGHGRRSGIGARARVAGGGGDLVVAPRHHVDLLAERLEVAFERADPIAQRRIGGRGARRWQRPLRACASRAVRSSTVLGSTLAGTGRLASSAIWRSTCASRLERRRGARLAAAATARTHDKHDPGHHHSRRAEADQSPRPTMRLAGIGRNAAGPPGIQRRRRLRSGTARLHRRRARRFGRLRLAAGGSAPPTIGVSSTETCGAGAAAGASAGGVPMDGGSLSVGRDRLARDFARRKIDGPPRPARAALVPAGRKADGFTLLIDVSFGNSPTRRSF